MKCQTDIDSVSLIMQLNKIRNVRNMNDTKNYCYSLSSQPTNSSSSPESPVLIAWYAHAGNWDPLSSKRAIDKLCELSVCYSTEKSIKRKENRTIHTIIMNFSSIIMSFMLFTLGPGGCLLKYLPLSVKG